jgi:hypothetical protein
MNDVSQYSHLKDLPLPIDVPRSGVQLLIGVGSGALIPWEVRAPLRPGQPYAERTQLGWVVRGPSTMSTATTAEAERQTVEMPQRKPPSPRDDTKKPDDVDTCPKEGMPPVRQSGTSSQESAGVRYRVTCNAGY